MKFTKVSLTAIALMLGIAGAFATTIHQHASKSTNEANLYWYDRQEDATYLEEAGNPQAEPATGCQGDDEICAKGLPTQVDESTVSDQTAAETILKD